MRELTEEERDKLVGQLYCENMFFNPVLDGDGKWIISNEESENCNVNKFLWVKGLPEISYNQPINDASTSNIFGTSKPIN